MTNRKYHILIFFVVFSDNRRKNSREIFEFAQKYQTLISYKKTLSINPYPPFPPWQWSFPDIMWLLLAIVPRKHIFQNNYFQLSNLIIVTGGGGGIFSGNFSYDCLKIRRKKIRIWYFYLSIMCLNLVLNALFVAFMHWKVIFPKFNPIRWG